MLKLSTILTLALKSTRIWWYQEMKYQSIKAQAQKIFIIRVIKSDDDVDDDEIKLICWV